MKQQHTLLYTTESQSACHSNTADRDWLCEVFQTIGQERFMELICAGSDWGNVQVYNVTRRVKQFHVQHNYRQQQNSR